MSIDNGAAIRTKDHFEVDLDRILVEEIGQFGKFQVKALVLFGVVHFFGGYSDYEYVYTAARVESRCFIPECETVSDFAPPWILNAVPAAGESFDNCRRFANSTVQPWNTTRDSSCPQQMFDRGNIVGCDIYVYENRNSAVYEFNLACDEWRRTLVGSASVLGMLFTLPMTGFFSDRFGRRLIMSITGTSFAVIGLVKYWANSYEAFVVGVFIQNLSGACNFTCAFILALEFVGPKHRAAVSSFLSICMTLGTTAQGFVMWAEPYWRHYILIISVPQLVAITYFWISPESVRWLISKKKFEEAKNILIKAAEANGTQLSEKSLMSFQAEKNRKANNVVKDTEPGVITQIFQHKTMLLLCLVTPVWWITIYLVYYGLTISSVEISGNKHLNYVTVNFVEIPGYWIGSWLMNRYGRKPLLIGSFWICGACQILYIFLPKGYYAASLTAYLIGKTCIAAALSAVFVYTAELSPTPHRTSLVCCLSMIGQLGMLMATFMPALRSMVWQQLPFAVFGSMALVSGLLVLLAPETLGQPLPDSMEEAANLGKGQCRSLSIFRLFRKNKCYNVN